MSNFIKDPEAEDTASQLLRRAAWSGEYSALSDTMLPANRVILRGFEWLKDEAQTPILRIYDLHLDFHPMNKSLEHLFLEEKPKASILIFDSEHDDTVLKIPRAHRYPGPFLFALSSLSHRDNYRVGPYYVERNLSYEAQMLDNEGFAAIILAGEINTKNTHPIHALLKGADKNPRVNDMNLNFEQNYHYPDYPNSTKYPDYITGRYSCAYRWNCSIREPLRYTVERFKMLKDMGRKTTRFKIGEPADGQVNWQVDEMTELQGLVETLELTSLTLMSASIAADMDRIANIKDPELLKKELENLQAMKKQLEMTLQQQQRSNMKLLEAAEGEGGGAVIR